MIYDLCIVGAGLFGSAAARHASANPSLKVCLVGPIEPTIEDRKNREIFSSHYDEGRITRILDDDPACEVLSIHSVKRYKELEKLSGIKFHSPVGFLCIAKTNGQFHQKLLIGADAKQVPILELCKDTFEKRFPYLKLEDDETAIFDDNYGGHISPRKMAAAQKKVAKLQGCDTYESVVSEIEMEKGLYEIKVDNQENPITAKRVIIATGAFINTKNFSVLKPLRVTKRKETVTLFQISEDEVKRLSSLPDVLRELDHEDPLAEKLYTYFLPPIKYPDGKYYLKIGMDGISDEAKDLEDIKQWYLSKGDKTVIDMEKKLLPQMLPGLKYDSVSTLTCVNCLTPTKLPYIDRITPTLTVAIAGNGKGAKFSDEVGRLAAQLSVTGNWDSELHRTRFNAIFEE